MVSVVDEKRNGVDRVSDRFRAIWIPPHVGCAVSDPAYQDPPGVEIDEEEDMEGFQACRLDGEQSQATIDAAWVRMNLLQASRLGPGRRFGAMNPADARG
jgi:hypothetical protein